MAMPVAGAVIFEDMNWIWFMKNGKMPYPGLKRIARSRRRGLAAESRIKVLILHDEILGVDALEFGLDVGVVDVEFFKKQQFHFMDKLVELGKCEIMCAVQVRLQVQFLVIEVPDVDVVQLVDPGNFMHFADNLLDVDVVRGEKHEHLRGLFYQIITDVNQI